MGDVRNLRDGVGAVDAVIRLGEFGGDSQRPYAGQAHTWTGVRGTAKAPSMTLRDLGDRIARGLAWLEDDEHGSHLDITALVQSALLEIEATPNAD